MSTASLHVARPIHCSLRGDRTRHVDQIPFPPSLGHCSWGHRSSRLAESLVASEPQHVPRKQHPPGVVSLATRNDGSGHGTVAARDPPKQGRPATSARRKKSSDGSAKPVAAPPRDLRGGGESEVDQRWADVAAELDYMTRTVRLVQWYPGHIAKAERDLKEQLKWVDVVIEVRDARIPMATTHPELDTWIGDRPKLLVMNREDMVTSADRRAWADHFARLDVPLCFTDGQHGAGILKLARNAMSVGKAINSKRRDKGLKPRSVRAAVVGFPNVGKSAVINRLMGKRACASAPRPGVTREVKWVRLGEGLDLLDAPGVLPARIADQSAAARLAMCNDIGEAAYAVAGVASILVEMLKSMPTAGAHVLTNRYKLPAEDLSGEEFLESLADRLCMGDVNQAAHRVLKDFRKGNFGWVALERPPLP